MIRPVLRAGAPAWCAGLLFLAAAGAARAQTPARDSTAPACSPELVGADTVVDTLFAWLPDQRRGEAAEEHRFRAAQQEAVIGALAPLPLLGHRDVRYANSFVLPPGAEAFQDAEVLVWFQVRDDGHLVGMKLERRSGWNAIDVAVQRAVLRAESLRTLQGLPPGLAGQPVDLWLAAGFRRMRNAANIAIAQMRRVVPRVQGGVQGPLLLSIDRGQFPMAALQAGLGDSVLIEFVVDTTGYVVPESIRLVHATWREYADEAMRKIRSARFVPIRIGRCAIPVRLQWSLSFAVRR